MKSYNYILIDDNELDMHVNKGLLELSEPNSVVYSFISCLKAMEFISENKSTFDTRSNILLLDVQMPDISGFECLNNYIQLDISFRNNTNIILLSSSIDQHDIRKAKNEPLISDIIEKPLVYEILERKVKKIEKIEN